MKLLHFLFLLEVLSFYDNLIFFISVPDFAKYVILRLRDHERGGIGGSCLLKGSSSPHPHIT